MIKELIGAKMDIVNFNTRITKEEVCDILQCDAIDIVLRRFYGVSFSVFLFFIVCVYLYVGG